MDSIQQQSFQINNQKSSIADGISSTSGGKTFIIAADTTGNTNNRLSANIFNSHSFVQTPTINLISNQKSITPSSDLLFLGNSNNLINNNINSNQGVIVLTTSLPNRALNTPITIETNSAPDDYNSVFGASGRTNITENQQNFPIEENIVVEQNSKLGVLLQIKVLEDKVNFI